MNEWIGPDAISAYATAAATAVAAWSLRLLVKDRQERSSDDLRQIAAQVNHWPDNEDPLPAEPVGALTMRRRGGRWGIRIENVSGVPVYDVTLIFRPPSGDQPIIVKDATVIGPRDSKFVPVPHLPEGSRWGSLAHIQATLTFVEPSGRCWTRDHRGRLTEGPYIHPEQGPLVPWPEVPRV